MGNVEAKFHQAMIDIYVTAKRECRYNANVFWNMINEHGGLATAKHLLATDKPSDGFGTLYLCGRLDLTVEAHVLKDEFRDLFTLEEIAVATERLRKVHYKIDQ